MEEKKGGPNIKYILVGILFTLQAVGFYDHIWNIDPNTCDMTYMWQAPEYIPITLPRHMSSQHPLYHLYSYGEGPLAVTLTAGQYSGQPVLFVPGNGGSYKQVRSLASVAYRKSQDDDENRHFDFFTVDLAEDLGALYGPSLEDQTAFVVSVIPVIQKLYLTAKPIIIVGHSMGGLVARAAVMTPSLQGGVVPLIITLATPHVAPPLPLDLYIANFYDRVNSYWALEKTGAVSDLALISVGGGRNDVQVSPLAVTTPAAHVTALTTAVPGCWASTDHQSIVWCRQLVLALVRALFDSVDRKTLAPHSSTNRLAAVFRYHLVSKHSGDHYVSHKHNRQMKLTSGAKWTEVIKRQLEHRQPSLSPHTYIMLPLTGQPKSKYHKTTVTIKGSDESDWIFACTANAVENGVRLCKSGMNLSRESRRLVDGFKMTTVQLRPLLEEGYTHLVISLPRQSDKVVVSWDTHGETDRSVSVATPRLVYSMKPTPILDHTPARALTQNIVLEGLNEPWHSYELSVLPSASCPANGTKHPQMWLMAHNSNTMALARRWVEGSFYVFRAEQDEIAFLPRSSQDSETEPLRGDQQVQLVLDSSCSYVITIKASLMGTFRRLLMLYGAQIPAFIVCHLMLALAMQLKSIGDSRYCPSQLSSLLALTPMLLVPFVKISAMVLKKFDVYNDQQRMVDSGYDLGLLPIFLFLCCMPLTSMLSGGVWITILTTGSTLNSMATKVFGASVGVGGVAADLAVTGLSKVPAVVAVALLALAFSTCGTLALYIAIIFYLIQLFDMYKDHVFKVILKLIPRIKDETVPDPPPPAKNPFQALSATPATEEDATADNAVTDTTTPTEDQNTPATPAVPIVPQSRETMSVYLHLSMLLLVIVSGAIQLPSFITWVVRIKEHQAAVGLSVDPSLIPSVATIAALAVLWQCSPSHDRVHYKNLGVAVHFLAVMTLLFSGISTFRLPYFIAAALTVVAVHQLIAPVKESKEKTE